MKQWKRSQPYVEPGCAWYNLTDLAVFASGYTRLAFQNAFFLQQAVCVLFSRHSCFLLAITLLPQRRVHRKCGIYSYNWVLKMLKLGEFNWGVQLETFCCVNITRRLTLLQGLKIVCSQPMKRVSFCLVSFEQGIRETRNVHTFWLKKLIPKYSLGVKVFVEKNDSLSHIELVMQY